MNNTETMAMLSKAAKMIADVSKEIDLPIEDILPMVTALAKKHNQENKIGFKNQNKNNNEQN
ncbi:hypothetical protein [Flavobacterium sp.]|uniref:hypothetical protein n=1 Tax=Flavobacterium sp. TaxID=239 RepID=UPI0025BDC747|nr:hypothetical protein [Flavobacterium sp.]MBA4155057.1 hypothetical protein [Flavobacterium sp.]